MSQEALSKEIIEFVSEIAGVENVTEESMLMDDLEMASIDIFTLLGEIEMEYHIAIASKHLKEIETVGDLIKVVKALKE